MSRRAALWFAWSLAGISLVMYVAAFVFALLTLSVASSAAGHSAGGWGASRGFGGLLLFLAVVVSTLAIAALFNPLRPRIQSFIDRRFYPRKYDAARILAAYGFHLHDEVDLKTRSDDLLGVVREAVQPTHASLWLRSSDGTPPAERGL